MRAVGAGVRNYKRAVEVVEIRVGQFAVNCDVDLFGEVLLDLLLGFLDWQFRF